MSKEIKNTTLPFILISDKTLASILKQNSYACIKETDTVCVLENNGILTFSDSLIDSGKIVYSDKLCI